MGEGLCLYGTCPQRVSFYNHLLIHFEFHSATVQRDYNLQDVLSQLLGQVTLEFISIRTTVDAIPQIQNILKKLQFKRRKRLKIQIVIKRNKQKDLAEDHAMIKFQNFMNIRLKYKLRNSVTDWMLIFKIVGSKPSCLKTNNNENCSISGYGERWLYPCICQKRSTTK